MDYHYTLAFLTSQVAQIIMNSKNSFSIIFNNLKNNFIEVHFLTFIELNQSCSENVPFLFVVLAQTMRVFAMIRVF